jgi:O-acetyl-ADP-ribose deacetylase (regulator of RNase III)
VDQFTLRIALAGGKLLDLHGPADITKETTEAIVNAANSSLLGGGGVDGAIHRAGGPAILGECRRIVAKIGRLEAGGAVLTTGGRLAAKYVIHSVGPVYRYGRDGEPEILASCYRQSVAVADDHAIRSIAFPSISTGAYGYPVQPAAEIALATTSASLARTYHVQHVRFILFDTSDLNTYVRVAEKLCKTGKIAAQNIEKSPS